MTESYHQACVGTRSEAACVHCIARKRKPISRPCYYVNAGWSSLVARWAHNPKVEGSNPSPATNFLNWLRFLPRAAQRVPSAVKSNSRAVSLSQPLTDVLQKASLFSALSHAELEALAKRAVVRSFEAGQTLFSEGDPCLGLYVVAKGTSAPRLGLLPRPLND
jgi:hypothetical protein